MCPAFEQQKVETILSRIRQRTAAVIGDLCLDLYYFLDQDPGEVSVETDLPTRAVSRWYARPGGAANVATNLKALGFKRVLLFGYVGADMPGRELLHQLESLGIDGSGILMVDREEWSTSVYTKIFRGECEEPRIDLGCRGGATPQDEQRLLESIEQTLKQTDIVIVNQQLETGLHTPGFRQTLARLLAAPAAPPHLVDARHYHEDFPHGIHKINDKEVLRLSFVAAAAEEGRLSPERAEEVLARLHERWPHPVFVTRAARGCFVHDGAALHLVPALMERPPIDPVGAGDSFLAGVAAGLSADGTPVEAALMGTLASGVTMHKRFEAGTATAEEILALARDADYRYSPDKAENPFSATFRGDTEIEVVTVLPAPGRRRFTHVVFDHDGTISVLRQGWERIMRQVMLECILGDHVTQVDGATLRKIGERVDTFIDDTTGVQTIIQMRGLEQMVREQSFVPPEKVRTPMEYKGIFNDRLMEIVRDRIEAFHAGRYGVEDLTVKGATGFLRRLAAMDGLTLYLASGTDAQDVRAEAAALGYATFFNGGIHGSVGDPDNDPKKLVMRQILALTGGADEVLVFGDGPVELREARKRGGYTVGLVSDEVRRYGVNPAKRERLILGGADLLIPDFSWAQRLIPLLFPDQRT